VTAATAAAATAVAAAATTAITMAVTAAATAAASATLGVRVIDHKARALLGVVHKFNFCPADIVQGLMVDKDLQAFDVDLGIIGIDIIVDRHPKLNTATAATGNVKAQGMVIQTFFLHDIQYRLRGFRGDAYNFFAYILQSEFHKNLLLILLILDKYYQNCFCMSI
jgi:outer membrane receptor protein involved in Fe transport